MLRNLLQERLIEVAKAKDGERLIDLLLAEAKECAYIFVDEDVSPDAIKPGASRLGGLPDLPANVAWPSGVNEEGKPSRYADFVAQLNFAEIPAVDGLALSSVGRLWIFMAAWRKSEAVLTTIYDPTGAQSLFRREAPTTTEWAAFPSLELEQDRPLSLGTVPLRFESGISLPFGDASFERALRAVPKLRRPLMRNLSPDVRQGQVGGHAYDAAEGHDHRLNVELAQRGMRDYIFPFTYQKVADLDDAIAQLPSTTSEKSRKAIQGKLERLRPNVQWIEQHRDELNEWQPFVTFNANFDIDLSWGTDTASLWTFIRACDLALGRFDRIVGETVE